MSTAQFKFLLDAQRHEPNSKRFEPLYRLYLSKGYEGSLSAAIAKR